MGNPLPNQPVGFRPEDKEVLLNEVPGAGGPRSAEEERDQTALQNLLLRIERLSQRMEEEVDAPTLNQQTLRKLEVGALGGYPWYSDITYESWAGSCSYELSFPTTSLLSCCF